MVFVIPKPGLMVPDPDRGGLLPVTGREVPLSQYWLGRISCGDVTESKNPAKPAKGG